MRRLALAALTVGIVGLIFAATKGSGEQRAAVASSPDAPVIGAPASSGASSPEKGLGQATPVRIASLKALRSQPVKVGRLP